VPGGPGPAPDGDAAFLAGYRDAGGPERYAQHLLRDVAPCEGGGEWRDDYGNGYVSRLQFHRDTWRRAEQLAGRDLDGGNAYDVGVAAAVWINALEASGSSPGGTGGWPVCWWKGER
jgi:hypothetical protein